MEKNVRNLDGKWGNGVFKVAVKGNTYKSFYGFYRYGKGTIEYDGENFTLTSTYASRRFFWWTPFVETVKGKYTVIKDEIIITELIISNIEGRYSSQNGKWVLVRA